MDEILTPEELNALMKDWKKDRRSQKHISRDPENMISEGNEILTQSLRTWEETAILRFDQVLESLVAKENAIELKIEASKQITDAEPINPMQIILKIGKEIVGKGEFQSRGEELYLRFSQDLPKK